MVEDMFLSCVAKMRVFVEQGWLHAYCWYEQGYGYTNAIAGAGPPIAAGAALTAKTLKNGCVGSFIGDGASDQGTVAEALNGSCIKFTDDFHVWK